MRGITLPDGGNFKLTGIRIEVSDDGPRMPNPGVQLQTDLWPYWLSEAIAGAADAQARAADISALFAAGDFDEMNVVLVAELRASMRAITSAAFAVDAFYGAAKERGGEHPQTDTWRTAKTARYKQVTETFRYHLKIRDNGSAQETKSRIKQLFQLRDRAVHAHAEYGDPVYRQDIDAAAPWEYSAFCASNGIAAVGMTVDMLWHFTRMLASADSAMQAWSPRARDLMDRVMAEYKAKSLPTLLEIAGEESVDEAV